MKLFAVPAAMLLSLPCSAHAHEAQVRCPGFEDGAARQDHADRFYSARARDIVRAGVAKDAAALAPLVAPDADFSIWRGDHSTSARRKGVAGAIEMASDLKAVSFQTYSVNTGPITITPSKCIWSVAVLFRIADLARGVLMIFDFADGLLVKARGDQVDVIEGDVR